MAEQDNLTDENIAKKVQSGDAGIFSALVERYEAKILRYARKFLSDHDDIKDAVQNIFLKSYININSYDAKRRFSPWIYRIAHNELVDALKRKQKKFLPIFNLDVLLPLNYNSNEHAEKMDLENMRKSVEKCMGQLEAKYKEPLYLFYSEELSYREIADIMKIPISTVGVRINRAKETVKKICSAKNNGKRK